jgi:hypothetical protein
MEMTSFTHTKPKSESIFIASLHLNICMLTPTPHTKDDVKALYTVHNQYAWKVHDDISSRPEDLASHHEFVLITTDLCNALVTCNNFWYSVYAWPINTLSGDKMNANSRVKRTMT